MATTISFKVGDTFKLSGQLVSDQVANTPVNITGYTIRSQLRNDAALIQSMTVSITDAVNGRYTVSATPVQTAAWPVGNARMDIEFTTNAGDVMSSDTIKVVIKQSETI